jgi:hypothetical protein
MGHLGSKGSGGEGNEVSIEAAAPAVQNLN